MDQDAVRLLTLLVLRVRLLGGSGLLKAGSRWRNAELDCCSCRTRARRRDHPVRHPESSFFPLPTLGERPPHLLSDAAAVAPLDPRHRRNP